MVPITLSHLCTSAKLPAEFYLPHNMRLQFLGAFVTAGLAAAQQYPGLRPQNQRFTLLMTAGAGESRTNLSLTAVKNGISEVLLLVGSDPATCVGTPGWFCSPIVIEITGNDDFPAYLNASLSNFEGSGGEYVALQLDVDGEAYGVGIPPIVSRPGSEQSPKK